MSTGRARGIHSCTDLVRFEYQGVRTFASIVAGQPFTIEDSSGNVVLRDRGVTKRTALFDTEGDDMPGGIELAELDFSFAGPHPGLFADFCAIVNDLLGP